MADAKITELTALGGAPADGDLIPVVDVSETPDVTKSMTVADLKAAIPPSGTKLYASATPIAQENTTSEITLITVTVPGGTLGTNNAIKIKWWVDTGNYIPAAKATMTIRLKYGATTIATWVNTASTVADSYAGFWEALLIADGATNAQDGKINNFMFQTDGGGQLIPTLATVGTATEDSTANKTLAVTCQWSSANSSYKIILSAAIVEIVR